MRISELQDEQLRYDEDYWEVNSPPKAKLDHVFKHLTKTVGKLAGIVERHDHGSRELDHQLSEEVIPDLLMHTLQLTNLTKTNLRELYLSRLERNKGRIKQKRGQRIAVL